MSINNFPSARAVSCMDFITSSHAILFGGRGVGADGKQGFLNDLWLSEDVVQWGWYAGSNVAGSKGAVSGPGTSPSARWKHSCAAHPETKQFVVFGGVGEHPANPNDTAILDDLYVYNEKGWEFLFGGSHSQVPDFHNEKPEFRNPGSRSEHASVMVENLYYVFGGQSVSLKSGNSLEEVMMADLWAFNMTLGNHTWRFVEGSTLGNTHGMYPSALGTGGPTYGPGARVGAAMTFNQLTNEIFIFGGFGYGYIPGEVGYLNDLWAYNTFHPAWYWLGGSSGLNTFGSGAVTAASTFPLQIPARASAILFSGNDGYESQLTVLGGISLDAKQPQAIADVWMCNVKIPVGFQIPAPSTTYPPIPTTATKHSSTDRPVTTDEHGVHATTHTPSSTAEQHTTETEDEEKTTHSTSSKTSKTFTMRTRPTRPTAGPDGRVSTGGKPALFEVGSPQKVMMLVIGAFVAILVLVGGLIFLGFAFISSPATGGSRTVLEPYNAV